MRNRQVGPDTGTKILADLVKGLTYKPGWTFELHEINRGQGSMGLTLSIGATVKNSVGDGDVQIMHSMPVIPAGFDRYSWERWILDQVLLVEKHETLEWFRIDGEALFFPEHRPGVDPYRIVRVGELKTQEQVDAPALPWDGLPVDDPHFADGAE